MRDERKSQNTDGATMVVGSESNAKVQQTRASDMKA